jgi:phage terminase large subunit-like protein
MERPALYPDAQAGGLRRIVIGVDPSVGSGLGAECGIVVAGVAQDGRAYILEDLSKRCAPEEWVGIIAAAYQRWGASAVVVEVNHGADLVAATIGRWAPNLPIVEVRGKVGKLLRAEPISLLSVKDRVRFAGAPGAFAELQRQLRTWDGSGDSPDRMDAMVYACLYLLPVGGIEELISVRRPGAARAG